MSEQDRVEQKEQAAQAASSEAALQSAFQITVREGEQRLHRSWPALLATGAVGGIDVSLGVLGLLLVDQATGSQIGAALHAGAPFGYLTWAGLLGWYSLGNIVGGVALVTVLRLVQVGAEAIEEQRP